MTSRDEILEAIKHAAKSQCGGVPLGKGIFERQTGIKETDWRGIHWARWGDAVEEAGFRPNTAPDRIEESAIFDKLIEAIRHYKKLPTKPELQIYRRKIDNALPSHTTIEKRFRSRTNLYTELAAYVAGKSKLQDIMALCEQFVSKEKNLLKRLQKDLSAFLNPAITTK